MKVKRRILTGLAARLTSAASDDRIALAVHAELDILQPVVDVGQIDASDLHAPGVVAPYAAAEHIPEDVLRAWLVDRTAGITPPGWHDGSGGAPAAGVHICRIRDAYHTPEFGAVITSTGQVLRSSVAEALYLTPTLSALPRVTAGEAGPVMRISRRIPRLDTAAVFMAWGGRFNYGHFLLDCLSALCALDDKGLLDRFQPISPPLNDWQREALSLMFNTSSHSPVRELTAPVVAVQDLVFANPMDHFLHAPNRPLDLVRARMLSNVTEVGPGLSRIYLSRRHDEKRRMINETVLESALEARGFTVVHPDNLSLAQQIALFREADVIVAPTGAALANTLFCKPDTKVFEIQPINYVSMWVRSVCRLAGSAWYGYFAQAPLSETRFEVEGAPRPGTLFEWEAPIDDFLSFLDDRI